MILFLILHWRSQKSYCYTIYVIGYRQVCRLKKRRLQNHMILFLMTFRKPRFQAFHQRRFQNHLLLFFIFKNLRMGCVLHRGLHGVSVIFSLFKNKFLSFWKHMLNQDLILVLPNHKSCYSTGQNNWKFKIDWPIVFGRPTTDRSGSKIPEFNLLDFCSLLSYDLLVLL